MDHLRLQKKDTLTVTFFLLPMKRPPSLPSLVGFCRYSVGRVSLFLFHRKILTNSPDELGPTLTSTLLVPPATPVSGVDVLRPTFSEDQEGFSNLAYG